jgi:uncharacterized protein (TIGR03086 family)
VRALVEHVTGEYLWVPEILAGKTIAEVGDRFERDVLGNDPLDSVVRAQQVAVRAVEQTGDLSGRVHLSFGDVPASDYITQMIIDSTIHSWDLARGIGADETLDPELVELSFKELQGSADQWRSAGAFGPEKQAHDESPQAQLLALTGR